MPDDQDVTVWLTRLKDGDERAAQVIWEAYFEKLLRLARRQLQTSPKRAYDDEDVVLSAFNSFCRAAARGSFPKLDDHDDLWKLLVTITARKVHAQRKRELAEKRGRGTTRGESVFEARGQQRESVGIDAVMGAEPTPEFAASFNETVARLLDQLDDEQLREIVARKMDGYTNEEIADRLQCATRTIERKLQRIRVIWQQIADAPDTT